MVPVKPNVPSVNTDLATFYKRYILVYNHIVSEVLKCPEIMTILDIIYKFMQLHERLVNKQKTGQRFREVSECLDKAMQAFDTLSSSLIMRHWRHPKIRALADLKMQATKMFKMNFLLRQCST